MTLRTYKKYFNLVEITLAMAIIAIGMSSILVLFPVGVNSYKAAIANNNLPDIAEYMLGYFEAGCQADWAGGSNVADADPNKVNGFTKKGSFIKDAILPTTKPTEADLNGAVKGSLMNGTTGLYATDKSGVFIYEQTTDIDGEKIVDFSTAVRIWQEKVSFSPDGTSSVDLSDNYAIAICMEFSWPVEKAYADREKSFFRVEIFNPRYEPFATVTP